MSSDRGSYAGIFNSLFDDPDYQNLPPDAKLIFLTVRLCKQAGAACIFRYYAAVLAEQTGLSLQRVNTALDALEPDGWIEREGPIIWVKNGLRYDPMRRLADPKHRRAIEKAVAELPHLKIVLRFCDYYEITRPFQGSSEGLERVSNAPRETSISISGSGSTSGSVLEERESEGEKRKGTGKSASLPDEDFLAALKRNPAYQHLDIEAELGRMDAWILANPGRRKTRSFIVNWLNRSAERQHEVSPQAAPSRLTPTSSINPALTTWGDEPKRRAS